MGFYMSKIDIVDTALKTIMHDLPEVQGVYLFGSFAAGLENANSDLDLAILLKDKLLITQCWKIQETIARHIDRDVELIDLRIASTVFKFQIVSKGKRIYCCDRQICDAFEALEISSYLRFNEGRGALIKDIKDRGQVL